MDWIRWIFLVAPFEIWAFQKACAVANALHINSPSVECLWFTKRLPLTKRPI